MFEVLYRYDPGTTVLEPVPGTADEALHALIDGNQAFAAILERADAGIASERKIITLTAKDLGLTAPGDPAPEQQPFAAVLSCSDARVPVEMVMWQQANDLFVVRVAGNTPGPLSMGSLDYAVQHLTSIRLLVVLGHTGCGAISAAANAYIKPSSYIAVAGDLPLRTIIDSSMLAVAGAAAALHGVYGDEVRQNPGYRSALIELSVIMHAALTATTVRQTFSGRLGPNFGVVYGVFNLENHLIGLPRHGDEAGDWQAGLWDAPLGVNELGDLAEQMARSRHIAQYIQDAGDVLAAGATHSN
jgi:carbonic anhydrase